MVPKPESYFYCACRGRATVPDPVIVCSRRGRATVPEPVFYVHERGRAIVPEPVLFIYAKGEGHGARAHDSNMHEVKGPRCPNTYSRTRRGRATVPDLNFYLEKRVGPRPEYPEII